MGTIYYVACKDCKVTRDLDKFYAARPIESSSDAIQYSKDLAEHGGLAFRAALLVSFMAEHQDHDCVFFDEHSRWGEELIPIEGVNDFVFDGEWWK